MSNYLFIGSTNIEIALARRQELKNAALQAKRTGDQVTALQFVRLVKVYPIQVSRFFKLMIFISNFRLL